ncbi:YfdX family protein [Nitratifractor sp.]
MKKIILSAVVAAAMMGSAAQAGNTEAKVQEANTQQQAKVVGHKTQGGVAYYSQKQGEVAPYVSRELERHHAEAMKQAPKEILQAFGDTYKALKLMQVKQLDAAQKALESADKAFDAAIKKYPDLKMIPLDERIFIAELDATPGQIKKAVDYGRTLLKGYHTQASAALLGIMKDEMDIQTTYLPMELYPVAVKKALAALKKKDVAGALNALGAGFGTLVVTNVVVPLPLLAAQDLVVQASKIDKTKKAEIEKLLQAAKMELQKAYYLGYTDLHPAAYNDLMKQIKGIEKEMGGKNMVEKLYEKIKKSFADLVGKVYHDSLYRKEAEVLKNPAMINGDHAAKAKVEETEAKDLFESKMDRIKFEKEAQQDEKKAVVK